MKTSKFYVHKSYTQSSGGNHPDCLYGPFASEEDAKYKVIELEPDLELDDDFDCGDYRYIICSTDDFPAEDQHGDTIHEENHQFFDFELDLVFGNARNVYARTITKIGTLNHERVIRLRVPELSFDDLIKAQDTDAWSNDEDQIVLVFSDLLDHDDLDEYEIEDLAVDIRNQASQYLFKKSELIHEAEDLKFFKYQDEKECAFFSVNSEEEILETTESPTKLFEQYDLDLGFAVHKITCSWDAFLIAHDQADELPDTPYEDRMNADLICLAKRLNIPVIFNNPDLGDFEVCILFPVSDLLDFPDLDQEEQDSFLADCDDEEDRDECMTDQYAKRSAGGGSRNIVGLRDFMRSSGHGFWDGYCTTSNTGGYLIKLWNNEVCTLIHC